MRFLLALLFTVAEIWLFTNAGKCGRKPVDVIFVLDESGSIWGPDFKKQLQFVQDLIDGFDIQPNGTRVGVATFDTNVRTIVQLGEIMDAVLLKRYIEGIRQLRGGTKTHLALKRLREMFTRGGNRSGASRVAVVITDGESEEPLLTALEADEVHREGIVVIAIGVGQNVKRLELEAIASQPDFVFTVENYDDLNSLLSVLAIKACPIEEEETPTVARTSTTAAPVPWTTKSWPEPAPATRTAEWKPVQFSTYQPTAKYTVYPSWTTQKQFSFKPIPKSVEGCGASVSFNVYFGLPDQLNPGDTTMALQFIRDITMLLGETPSFIRPRLCPRICFTPSYLPYESNKLDFLAELDSRQGESVTQPDQQLEYVRKQEEEYRGRYPVDKQNLLTAIAVLMVDNRLANMERMLREMEYARRDGIKVMTIGVGDYVDRNQLWKMASNPRDLMYLKSYDYLPTIRDDVIERVCIRGLVQSARNSLD